MKNYLLFLSMLLCVFSNTCAQEQANTNQDTISTDRPDATEASNTVGKGVLQIETGIFYQTFENNTIETIDVTLNTMLIRYGILDNMELRFGYNFVEGKTKINGSTASNILSGFSPMLFGAKIDVVKQKGWLPEIALIGHLHLPFLAATDYRPETTGADFRFSMSHTLSSKSSLGYNLGAAWGNDSSQVAYVYTLAYGYSFTSNLGGFVEIYGDLPEDASVNHFWDAGLTYLLSNNFQLDASLGTSITKGQDIYLNAGFSYRIPKKKIKELIL